MGTDAQSDAVAEQALRAAEAARARADALGAELSALRRQAEEIRIALTEERDDLRRQVAEHRLALAERDAALQLQAIAVLHDLTGQRAQAERQALVARELDHRAKNLLAVVQSILRLTLAPDLEGYRQVIEGRIGALARAHTLLSGERFRGAQLRPLVEEELAPYAAAAGRIRIAGPALPLAPAAVQALAMTLHELATNAAKYGALSVPEGSLAVEWALAEAGSLLRLSWTEAGGPPVPPAPGRRGFGSRLIQATIEEQLGGWMVQEWNPTGLRCEIGLPAGRSVLGQG